MNLPDKQTRKKFFAVTLPALLILLIAVTQFYFRQFDNNYLVSWSMVFGTIDPSGFFLVMPAILILASLVATGIYFQSRARLFFLFLSCFIASAFCWGIPEVIPDVSRYFAQAKHLEVFGIGYFFKEWGRGIPVWTDLPTMPFLYGLIFKIFGETRIFIQAFLAVLFAMTAVLTSMIGKALWDEETGIYAGALLLGIPFLISVTPMMLTDIPTMFFLALSIYLFIRDVESGGTGRGLATIAAVVLTAFCKYSTWPMLSILPVISIVYALKASEIDRRQIIKRSIGIFLFAFLSVGLVITLTFDTVAEQIHLLMTFQRTAMGKWSDTYTSTFLFQVSPIITAAAAISLLRAGKKRDLNFVIAAWLIFLLFFFIVRRSRYTIPVFPMVALMASYGLNILKDRELKKRLVACVVAGSLVTAIFAYVPFLEKMSAINLKQAGEFLDTLDVGTVEVFPLAQQHYSVNPAIFAPILDFHTNKKVIFNYEPGASTPDEDYRRSLARYSWIYRNPVYYSSANNIPGNRAVAIIANSLDDPLPIDVMEKVKHLTRSREFSVPEPVRAYQTVVKIFW